jgi:putative toxin-antitoxin system antitoxin component (TIGR02293 family)
MSKIKSVQTSKDNEFTQIAGLSVAKFKVPETAVFSRTKNTLFKRITLSPKSGKNTIDSTLPFEAFTILRTSYKKQEREMRQLVSIAPSTLTRRKREKRLTSTESDRILRYALIKDAAMSLFEENEDEDEDEDEALSWLNTELVLLDNKSPLEHAKSELGAKDVEKVINRIRYGVFS